MASASVVGGKAVTPAASTAGAVPDTQLKGVNRREFLFYIWGASMALFLGELGGGIVWFALPQFRAGEFGGVFELAPDKLPTAAVGTVPTAYTPAKIWLSNTDDGFRAISIVCTHLGCLYKWAPQGATGHEFPHFVCPCHGSQFTNKGEYVTGPASRSLDQFEVTVLYNDGTKATTAGPGAAVPSTNIKTIQINTGKKYTGKTHA